MTDKSKRRLVVTEHTPTSRATGIAKLMMSSTYGKFGDPAVKPLDPATQSKVIATMREHTDRAIAKACGIPTEQLQGTASSGAHDTFTIEKLKAAMTKIAEIPPLPIFGMTRHISRELSITVKNEGRDYAIAHPDFWDKVLSDKKSNVRSANATLFGMEIIDLDDEANQSDAARFMRGLVGVHAGGE